MNSRRFKSRKYRTKAKKPKFLSLRLQLSPDEAKTPEKSIEVSSSAAVTAACQLDLFPHPENLAEEKYTYTHDQDNVAYFFSAGDGGATTTLTGLLDASTITTSSSNNNNSISITSLSPSASLTYAYGGQNSELARTALRNREREPSEEKWVYYSEVVERKVKEEEVTSGAVDLRWKGPTDKTQRLSLKLDYEDILNAWSDKGPLYIHAETPQTVPDLNDEFFGHETSHELSWGCNGGTWTVPEKTGNIYDIGIEVKKEEEMKLGQREASVLRYKEKRQNRLFAKKIRYQVRKLNAEKRPRVKGRFVKRD